MFRLTQHDEIIVVKWFNGANPEQTREHEWRLEFNQLEVNKTQPEDHRQCDSVKIPT